MILVRFCIASFQNKYRKKKLNSAGFSTQHSTSKQAKLYVINMRKIGSSKSFKKKSERKELLAD
jgi:hypothetical protein